VLKATSGEEVLDVYGREGSRINLVVLDLGMPGMGGEKCLEQLKQMDPTAKVIVASGYSSHRIAKSPKDFGAASFICKPYRLEGLLLTIRNILNSETNSNQS
jgi:DNA-binding NtrC family response regulator